MLKLWRACIKASFEAQIVLQFPVINLSDNCSSYEYEIITYYLLISFLIRAIDVEVNFINF